MGYTKYENRGRINYEDDLVVVFDNEGYAIYKGMEDYEPMKWEDWKYDTVERIYRFGEYVKICVEP